MSPRSDILILGAGAIGLSLALELATRGGNVAVSDPREPLSGASTAAAGMLAVEDPANPEELRALSRYSASLYGGFLARIAALSGMEVPFQTEVTRQHSGDGPERKLAEHSVDPRQLAPALRAAVEAAGVPVHRGESSSELIARAGTVVYTTGAWGGDTLRVRPRKGQMLRVGLPADGMLTEVIRDAHLYIVPRTRGPRAGTALVGATVEEAGFDVSVRPESLRWLRREASALLPGLEDEARYPALEAWAGLRPATPDGLPLIGRLEEPERRGASRFAATGHFRNGILLAPGTAAAMADLLESRPVAVDLGLFSPARFAGSLEMA